MMKVLSLTIPLLNVLDQILTYANLIKELEIIKMASTFENFIGVHHCSVVTSMSLAKEKGDLGLFIIPFKIGSSNFLEPNVTKGTI